MFIPVPVRREIPYLAAYLAARKRLAVDVGVSSAAANRANDFRELARGDPLRRGPDDARRGQRSSHGSRRRRAGGSAGRPVVEVGAQENHDPASDCALAEVQMRLQHGRLEARGRQLVLNLGFVLVDPCLKTPACGGQPGGIDSGTPFQCGHQQSARTRNTPCAVPPSMPFFWASLKYAPSMTFLGSGSPIGKG